MSESTRTTARTGIIFLAPLAIFAGPALAASITGDAGVSLPGGVDPNAVGYLLCVYILRDMHLRTMRTMEALLLRAREPKEGEE